MLRPFAIVAAVFVGLSSTCVAQELQQGSLPKTPQAASAKPATANSATTKKKKSAKAKKPTPQKQAQPLPPQPPPPPPTLEQQPAVAPEVLYRGGLLTIIARNSTMSDVLAAVRRVTGANIDRPPSGGGERVVGQFGPGLPRDVLNHLLNGSRYDYVILGSATRPGAIDRVLLTQRGAPTQGAAVAANTQNQPPQHPGVQPPAEEQTEPDTEPEVDSEDMTVPEREQEAAPAQEPTQMQREPAPGQPPQGQAPQAQPPDQNQPNQQGQPNVKSPEELLRELQQMQQQQQQKPPDQEPQ